VPFFSSLEQNLYSLAVSCKQRVTQVMHGAAKDEPIELELSIE
jgi:hypothetical protein